MGNIYPADFFPKRFNFANFLVAVNQCAHRFFVCKLCGISLIIPSLATTELLAIELADNDTVLADIKLADTKIHISDIH